MTQLNRLGQGTIGRCDKPHVDNYRLRAADGRNLFFLQQPEQLRLQVKGQLANLVEEQRATLSCPHHAQRVTMGTGKRTLDMPVELTLEERLSHGGTVHRNERRLPAGRAVVNPLGDKLLARAGFTLQENHAVIGSHGVCRIQKPLKQWTSTDKASLVVCLHPHLLRYKSSFIGH